jgi:4-aminobutyrate aminotransferase/diaminobutyrate-pyruvate transaminase/4-aminobutyrate aminotransferase/(S)-3-amino-2-methylpropionate transaminase
VLVFDEVQAGFGRTGTLWGFEHYGVLPDLTTWGKGITSSLPLAAVAGKPELMDMHAPGSASSTHTGNPVCCAAALANLDIIEREDLAGHSAKMGVLLHTRLRQLQRKYPKQIGCIHGKGLVAGVGCVKAGTRVPDGSLARDVTGRCVEKGLLLFNPVGPDGCTIKICPPLVIPEDAIQEGCDVLEKSFAEAVSARGIR